MVAVGLALAAALVVGLAAPARVLAAGKRHKPHAPSWVLVVEHNGTPVRTYTLAQLEALTPFAGYAGFMKITGTVVGPDAVTGARVTDIVAAALGTPFTAGESVDVADADPDDSYDMTFSYDQLVNLTGFTMYNATNGNPVAISSLKGPLATLLIYSDPAGVVMPLTGPKAAGPLRFIIADATSENVVMYSQLSIYHVNLLNVIDPGGAR
jgi:hypothetical protein